MRHLTALDWWQIVTGMIGFYCYVTTIFKGSTRPNPFSWGILTVVLTLIALSTQAASKGRADTTVLWVYAVGDMAIFFISLKWRDTTLCRSDICSAIAAGVIAVIWKMTGLPLLAMWLSIGVHAIGMGIFVRHIWQAPYEENIWAFIWFDIACTISCFSVRDWSNTANCGFQIYGIVTMLPMLIFMLYARRRYSRENPMGDSCSCSNIFRRFGIKEPI